MKILFADDHALFRESLVPLLGKLREGAEVREAGTLERALELAAGGVDLVVIDLQMPGMNGLEGLDRMREAVGKTPVVVLSGYSDKRTINAVLEKGAAGFVPKSATGKTLVRALEAVLDGEKYVPSTLYEENLAPSLMPASRGGSSLPGVDNPMDRLTEREAEALKLLIAGKTNKQIAIQLGLQEITVKIHLRNAYKKIGAGNRADAVRIAYENGWQGLNA